MFTRMCSGRGNPVKDWMVGRQRTDARLQRCIRYLCGTAPLACRWSCVSFYCCEVVELFGSQLSAIWIQLKLKRCVGELFDELLQATHDPELDVRNVLRSLRHSALFALKDFE